MDDLAEANAVSKGLAVQGFLMLELVYFYPPPLYHTIIVITNNIIITKLSECGHLVK